jgi:uncharacterized membrane protein YeaQ/YmgE (transglycosylase-associated protein family)
MGVIAWIVPGLTAGLTARMAVPGGGSQNAILTRVSGIARALRGGRAAAQAVDRGLGGGVGGAPGGRDRASLLRGLLVGVSERGEGLAQVPGEVSSEHADQHVAADPVLQPVVDGPQVPGRRP